MYPLQPVIKPGAVSLILSGAASGQSRDAPSKDCALVFQTVCVAFYSTVVYFLNPTRLVSRLKQTIKCVCAKSS